MERRKFLLASGVSALTVSALGSTVASETNTDGPKAVVEEYYRRAAIAESASEFAREIPELAHERSPLSTVAEDVPQAFADTSDQELVGLQVVTEDVGAERIRAFSDFFTGSLSETDIETFAGNNAIVAARIEYGGEEATARTTVDWLVVPEDGGWRLAWLDEVSGPRAVAEELYQTIDSIEQGYSTLDESIRTVTHSASPLRNAANYTPWLFNGLRRQELLGTEVVAKDLTKAEIAGEFSSIVGWTSESELDALAGDNAVVGLRLRDDDVGVQEFVDKWLLAPERDEWNVVWV